MRIDHAGNVGIGTTNPGEELHIWAPSGGWPAIRLERAATAMFDFAIGSPGNLGAGNKGLQIHNSGTADADFGIRGATSGDVQFLLKGSTGNVGIGLTNPAQRLDVYGSGDVLGLGNVDTKGTVIIRDGSGQTGNDHRIALMLMKGTQYASNPVADRRISMVFGASGWGYEPRHLFGRITGGRNSGDGGAGFLAFHAGHDGSDRADHMTILANGNVGIGTASPQATLGVNGTVQTKVLEITGGSDLAEPFGVSGAETIQPGMVLAIDPDQPGRLRLSDRAYDRTVAGIVSGANGIKPGLTMKQEGTVADGSLPVSLTGRVYCWADASNGPIEPGDLLTTSDTPGHVMKVRNYKKAQGAIIGKAMTGLKQGKGLVLVLVTLQ